MHVRTYSTDFAPPHFAAGGIPKNTPHGTMQNHTAYIYILSLYPFLVEFIVTVFFFARLGIATVTWDELLYTENVFCLACSFLAVPCRKTITCIQHGMAIICPPIV